MKKPSPILPIIVVITTFLWTVDLVDAFIRHYVFPPPAISHPEFHDGLAELVGYVSSVLFIILYIVLWWNYFKSLTVYRKFVTEQARRDAAAAAAARAADAWPPPPT